MVVDCLLADDGWHNFRGRNFRQSVFNRVKCHLDIECGESVATDYPEGCQRDE